MSHHQSISGCTTLRPPTKITVICSLESTVMHSSSSHRRVWRSLELPEGSPKTKINKAFRDVVGRYEEECAEEIERNSRPISQLPIYDYMHIYSCP